MRLPVKDRTTIPYMTEREIPAIKAALSAWRKLRRDKEERQNIRDLVSLYENTQQLAASAAKLIARNLEKLAQIEERIRKEDANAGA